MNLVQNKGSFVAGILRTVGGRLECRTLGAYEPWLVVELAMTGQLCHDGQPRHCCCVG